MRRFLIAVAVIAVLLGIAAYALSAADIPRATLEAKYATPPSQFVVLPDGARVHYRIRGAATAPALVLLHGSNASLFTWEAWSKNLSDRFRVVSLDLPGHGLTGAVPNHDYSTKGMAVFVAEFADKIGLKKFALAGNSMGGGVAARFAEMYPDRVTALILVDAGGMPGKMGDRIPLAFQLLRMPWLQAVMAHANPKPLAREGLGKAIVRKSVLTEQMIDLYTDMALLEGTREATFERFNQTGEDYGYVKAHIRALKMPVLILWGQEDHLIPVETAHTWKAAIPGSKLIVYPATGHIPMEEVADQSAADVRAFLSTREAAQ
ncbi:MAG TPA: alpha/beta hydrolase [Rhizomicrobium sp.]|nr:alpha/beta hydrolase [Rhizomicrobium sp.]